MGSLSKSNVITNMLIEDKNIRIGERFEYAMLLTLEVEEWTMNQIMHFISRSWQRQENRFS